jgi:hypothetical protein
VFPVNPLQASRYRGRHGVSGAKSDGGDAHMLADVVRTDAHQLRPAAGDSPQAGGIKVLARTHKTLIWERSAVVLRLRAQLREYFPAAVAAFEDLDAPDALELLVLAATVFAHESAAFGVQVLAGPGVDLRCGGRVGVGSGCAEEAGERGDGLE